MTKKKQKKPKSRNPVAKAVTKLRPKVKPSKKKNYVPNIDIPSTKGPDYSVMGGD